jgi:tetratricopeptide (TPR) repeat protein
MDAKDYFKRGVEKSYKQDYEGAILDLTQAIHLKHDYLDAYWARAEIHLKRQDYDTVIKDTESGLKLNPDSDRLKKIKAEAEVKKAQEAFKTSEKKYNLLTADMQKIKNDFEVRQKRYEQEIEDLKSKFEGFFKNITAQGLSDIYNKQAKWQHWTFIVLRAVEYLIYVVIFCVLYNTGFVWVENLFEQEVTNFLKIMLLMLIKIGIFIPVYLLIRSINKTANRFSQRSELDGDTATQWLFFDKMELELRDLKDNPDYAKLYNKFMDENITLRHKTNFQLLEEIMVKRNDKALSLKQVDQLADTAQKIKNVCIAPKEETKEKAE